jgi:competence protein ComEA
MASELVKPPGFPSSFFLSLNPTFKLIFSEKFMKMIFAILMLCSFVVFAEPVDINRADAETISKALKGVGPKKAEAIVQYRKEHGDFKTLKDLENVKGIGEKTAKELEKDILFSDSATSVEGGAPVDAATPATAVSPVEDKAGVAQKPDSNKKSK